MFNFLRINLFFSQNLLLFNKHFNRFTKFDKKSLSDFYFYSLDQQFSIIIIQLKMPIPNSIYFILWFSFFPIPKFNPLNYYTLFPNILNRLACHLFLVNTNNKTLIIYSRITNKFNQRSFISDNLIFIIDPQLINPNLNLIQNFINLYFFL